MFEGEMFSDKRDREPVASPQATRLSDNSSLPLDYVQRYGIAKAAQPAAGTLDDDGSVSFTFDERTQVLRYLAMNARGMHWPINWDAEIVKRVLEKIQPAIGLTGCEATTPQAERTAIRVFKETRGKHEGDHIFNGSSCSRCEESYIAAEAELDSVLDEARAVAPVETPELKCTCADASNNTCLAHCNVGVETRLTAEQFYIEYFGIDKIHPRDTVGSTAALRFAEAFRDKSEAARSPFAAHNWQHWNEMCKIAQEQAKAALEQNAELREEIERLREIADEYSEHKLMCGQELRAKLAERDETIKIEREAFDKEHARYVACSENRLEWSKRAEAAEAEVAALRERERWVSVEEKLPEVEHARQFTQPGPMARK